jgi:hypothetical protein
MIVNRFNAPGGCSKEIQGRGGVINGNLKSPTAFAMGLIEDIMKAKGISAFMLILF